MKAMSARASCAPAPRRTMKPEPAIFAPAARSRMPSFSPISQCGTTPAAARGSPQRADDAVRLLPAVGDGGERDVREPEEDLLERALGGGESLLERGDRVAERARLGDERVGVLLGLLAARDLLRRAVARGLLLVGLLDQRAAVALEGGGAVEDRRVARRAPRGGAARRATPPGSRAAAGCRARSVRRNAGFEPGEAAVRIDAHAVVDHAPGGRGDRIVRRSSGCCR